MTKPDSAQPLARHAQRGGRCGFADRFENRRRISLVCPAISCL